MDDSYPVLMRALADLAAGLDARRGEAEQWYEQRCAAATTALSEATERAGIARQVMVRVQREVEAVDNDACGIWRALADRLGPAAARFAGAPLPSTNPAEAGDDPGRWLERARDLLDRAGEVHPVPRSAYPALMLFGVLGAVAATGLATAGRLAGDRYGGDLAVGLPVIALVVTLLGPFVGLGPAKLLADRRQATLDLRTSVMVLVAGLLTTGLLVVFLR